MKLPQEFEKRMQNMLGEEYAEFLSTFQDESAYQGIRINTLKSGAESAVVEAVGDSDRIKWCKNGYYADKSVITGKHPYHVGGLVYFQEPSAMSTVEVLGIKKGDYVLDLCAAPGGKATQAAEKLCGEGLLVANEIIPKRAQILAENIQRMGIKNAIVTNESPDRLGDKYKEFFDKIIVDAPCSGEGMFKKEPQAVNEWSKEHTISCAERQKHILSSAFKMLRGDGYLVYSTCTFAPCENEGVADWVLKNYPEVELVPIEIEGMSDAVGAWAESSFDLSGAKRIFPHKSKGEGHFVALFHKKSGGKKDYRKNYKCDNEKIFREFERDNLNTKLSGELVSFGDRLFLMPDSIDIDKIKVLIAGLELGVCKKGRFEPSHALCLALSCGDFKSSEEITRPEQFFKGETMPSDKKGWTAALYNGFPIGWGKASEGILKNHFPKYLRF